MWLRRPGRRLRMERLGRILQMTASTCWCLDGAVAPAGRVRALQSVSERSWPYMRSPTNKFSGHGSPAPVAAAAFNLPRHMCTIRRTHEHGRSLVLVVRMPPQEEQHTDALTARLAGMLLGALLRDVLAREAWTRFPARCFGSPASCLGSPTADTLRVVQRSYTAVFQPHRAPRLCPR